MARKRSGLNMGCLRIVNKFEEYIFTCLHTSIFSGLAKTSLKFVGGYTAAEFDFSDKMRHAMLSCRNIRKMILDQFQVYFFLHTHLIHFGIN